MTAGNLRIVYVAVSRVYICTLHDIAMYLYTICVHVQSCICYIIAIYYLDKSSAQ